MLECMPICGLSHVLHGEVSRDHSKILDVGQTHDSNDENAQWYFTRLSLQGTRGIQINGVMAILLFMQQMVEQRSHGSAHKSDRAGNL